MGTVASMLLIPTHVQKQQGQPRTAFVKQWINTNGN
jgi:hypothetical protein